MVSLPQKKTRVKTQHDSPQRSNFCKQKKMLKNSSLMRLVRVQNLMESFKIQLTQWRNGRSSDSRCQGRRFDSDQRHLRNPTPYATGIVNLREQ